MPPPACLQALQAFIVLLMLAAPACAADLTHALPPVETPDAGTAANDPEFLPTPPARPAVEPLPRTADRPFAGRQNAVRIGAVDGCRVSVHNRRWSADSSSGPLPARRTCRRSPLVLIAAVTAFVLFLAWRTPAGGRTPPPVPASPTGVVCLACRRCNRVVDIPRNRLSRRVFCPRCGAVLPREA